MKRAMLIVLVLLVSATIYGWKYERSVNAMTDVVTEGIFMDAENYSGTFRRPYLAVIKDNEGYTLVITFNGYSISRGEVTMAYRIDQERASHIPISFVDSTAFVRRSKEFIELLYGAEMFTAQVKGLNGNMTAIFRVAGIEEALGMFKENNEN